MKSHIKVFKSAHEEYVEKIKEYATGDKEEMKHTFSGLNIFLKETQGQVYDVLSLHNNFKFKLKIPKLKTKLSNKFKVYN